MSLLVITADFDPSVLSVEPAFGPAGSNPEIVGHQFADPDRLGIDVYVDGVLLDSAVVLHLNETRIRITMPAHADGFVPIRVVFPSGVSKTLANAFQYVAA